MMACSSPNPFSPFCRLTHNSVKQGRGKGGGGGKVGVGRAGVACAEVGRVGVAREVREARREWL